MEDQNSALLKTIEVLSASVASLSDSNTKLTKQNEELVKLVKELRAQIAYFQRMQFGRKSERFIADDPNQLLLFPELYPEQAQSIENAHEESASKIEKETKEEKKAEKRNRQLLENLPVLEKEVIEPKDIDLRKYKKIGEEVTRILKFQPGKLYVKEIVRPKYALISDGIELPESGEQPIVIAPMPLLPIYKGIADATLLAEVLLQKYEYHIPFYRQVQQFKHLGIEISESTIDGWLHPVAQLLKPLYEVLKKKVLESEYIQSDETTEPVINHETHKADKEYLWMIRAVLDKLVFFHYYEGSRAGEVVKNLVGNYKGYLQSDGYTGYETAFAANPDVHLVACMAHIRRKFEQALNENRSMAEYALKEIQLLYSIERQIKDLSAKEKKSKREELSRPIMTAMRSWMENEGIKYGERTLIGKAVRYAYTRWDKMMIYLEDGCLLIDNNLAENAIRPVTIGRKNYLFCGNHKAAEDAAIIYSLLATCKNHEVNPRDYLNDVIARMPYMEKASNEELLKLLPHIWKS